MATSTKQSLLEDLRANGDWAEATLRGLADEQLAIGRYENGWNGRQILAHIAAIEWTYPRLLDLARHADRAKKDPQGRAQASARGGIDDYNRRQVEKRAASTREELLDEFLRNRMAFLQAVADADGALFDVEVRSAGGRTGKLSDVLREVAIGHVRGHIHDIVGEVATHSPPR